MTDFAGKSWNSSLGSDSIPHPMREQLLLFLDGELTERERENTKTHLEACWKCRAQMAEIEATITAFSHFDDDVLATHLPPPPNDWRGFGAQLHQLSSSNEARPWRTRWRNWWTISTSDVFFLRRSQPAWAIVAMLLVGLVAVVFLLLRSTPVSAQELLQRSMQAEAASLQKVAEPVLYRKLQVRRQTTHATEAVTWESWRAAHGDQFRQRVADHQGIRFLRMNDRSVPPLLSEMEQILHTNHLDAQRPLSAVAFDGWRTSMHNVVETVRELGDQMTLTVQMPAPYTLHAIRQASLLVRRPDWHVVALHLQIQGATEVQLYELSEAAYEVLPLDALTVFANLALPTLTTPVAAPPVSSVAILTAPARVASVPPPLPVAVTPLPSAAALHESEVAAIYALHKLRADLGEQIEVTRNDSRLIVVRGLVQTAARKEELLQSLNPIAFVRTELQTVEEAVQQAQQAVSPSASIATTMTTIDVGVANSESIARVNPFQQKLAEFFGGRRGLSEAEREAVNTRVTQFYNGVEADASAALSAAWALRRLQERFAATTVSDLDPSSRQRLDEMLANHTSRLRQRVWSLQTWLRPHLLTLTGDVPTVAPVAEATRVAKIQAAFRSVEQISRLTDQLIASHASTSMSQTARALLTEFSRLDVILSTLEKH